jgi:acyl-CoA thioesterase-1
MPLMCRFIVAAVCLFAASAASAKTIRIVAIGDSNFDVPGLSQSDMYPAQLERALRARGLDVTVTNAGRRGDSTTGVMGRMARDVPEGTDVALVSVGVNDPIYHGLSIEQSKANVASIVAALNARGIVTINLLTGLRFQRSAGEDPNLHVEKVFKPGTTQWHLNAAGNAVVVKETLPQVIQAVAKAQKKR